MGRNKVKNRGCLLNKELDDRWQEYLNSTGLNHSQAVRQAIETHLNHYYPEGYQNDKTTFTNIR